MASRKVEDLTPEVQAKLKEFAVRMAEEGIPWMLTCTLRPQEEQDALYEQGRTKPGKIVTWTRHSKHTPRQGYNGKSRAFDIAILKDGKPTWDVKVSVDGDDIPDYDEAGRIGKECGLRWGGDFGDRPHFEGIQ
jgi:peptidoglycan L-alanyl-D-glutamate endopeptidase CwlK